MTIFFKLAQEILVKSLSAYIENSEKEDQSLVQSAWGRKLTLSSAKRLLAQRLIDSINQINLTEDKEIQQQLDSLLRICKGNALDENLKQGGSEGRLESLIDEKREWLERLLKKIVDNHLINIPDNKHPFSIFCQKMVKYFDHKIHEELNEWHSSHAVRQALGFTSMPLEKAGIIHEAIMSCIKNLYRLDNKKDYPEGIKSIVLSTLKELLTNNSSISSRHAVPISAPIPVLGGFFGLFKLPLGHAQPSDGFLKTCITEALQEINTLSKTDLPRIVDETSEHFQIMFQDIACEETETLASTT